MKEKIKKHDNIIVIATFILLSVFFTLMQEIEIGDEIWNFQNVYKMVNGYTIYKDANVIITPIFFVIGKITFELFGKNIFIFRVYNLIIYTILMLIIYKIFKVLKISKKEAFLYTLIMHCIMYRVMAAGANYNILAILWVNIGLYISLKIFEKPQYNILNGILIYLTLFTKQNIGIYYIIGTVILQIIRNGINKKTITNLLKQIAIPIAFVILSILIMYVNGNLNGFVNYCFLGLLDFNGNRSITIVPILYLLLALIVVIFAIIQMRLLKNSEEKNNLITMLSIGIPILLMSYPICNEYHAILGLSILIVAVIYMLYISIIKDFIKTKIVNICITIMVIIIMLLQIKLITININNFNINVSFNNPYFGAVITQQTKEKIEKVNRYIKEKDEKVIIFSQDAALYNIAEKRNNGEMDLPFRGNLGYKGEDNMLEQIKSKNGYEILIKDEMFWQESQKIHEYIKENYEKIGEIEEFQIYYIK